MEIEGNQKDTTAIIGNAMGIEDVADRCFMTDFFVLISDVERSISLLRNVPKKQIYINTIKQLQTTFFTHNLPNDHWPNIKNIIKSGNLPCNS
jgi:hypothetical protein